MQASITEMAKETTSALKLLSAEFSAGARRSALARASGGPRPAAAGAAQGGDRSYEQRLRQLKVHTDKELQVILDKIDQAAKSS